MAIDKRTARLGVLALVSTLLIGRSAPDCGSCRVSRRRRTKQRCRRRRLREVLIPPERGRIFDAKGRIMADNQRILTVAIDWSVIKKPKVREALFNRLSGPLEGAGHRSAASLRPVLRRTDHPEVHEGSAVQHAAAAAAQRGRRRRHGHVSEGAQRRLPGHPDRRAVEACLPVLAAGQPRRRLPRADHQGDREASTRPRTTTPTNSSARSAWSRRWKTRCTGRGARRCSRSTLPAASSASWSTSTSTRSPDMTSS